MQQPKHRSIDLSRAAQTGQSTQRPMYDQAADDLPPHRTQRSNAQQGAAQPRETPSRRVPQGGVAQRSAPQTAPPRRAQQSAAPRSTARPRQATERTPPPQQQTAQPRSGARRNSTGARPARSAQRAAGTRTAAGAAARQMSPVRGKRNNKKQTRRRMGMTLLCICAVLAAGVIGLRVYLGTLVKTGEVGSVTEEIKTPPQLARDQMSLLVVGIDYTLFDGDAIQRDPIGQTDMILYLRFNLKDNTLRMLQIPRDLFMGTELPTGGTGKINALFKNGSKDDNSRIDNLAVPISELLHLPIDSYVSIDMVSLREIVDVFGGLEVYVADSHDFDGSHLDAGWQTLHGDMLEFFLRDRHNTATGDIGRLDNQRYFYSALFRRLRTATWQDVVKLTPVAQQYINTDLSVTECAALGIRMLKIPSSNIMLCRLPTYDSTENYNVKHAVQIADVQGAADLLNEYFRTAETQIAADQYSFADWPHAEVAHAPNVQWMNTVDADGGGTVGESAGAAVTGDDLLAGSTAPTEPGTASS